MVKNPGWGLAQIFSKSSGDGWVGDNSFWTKLQLMLLLTSFLKVRQGGAFSYPLLPPPVHL
jgi:hypothetical protein